MVTGFNCNNLIEANIPEASLGDRNPEAFKVKKLKFWLLEEPPGCPS